MDRYLIKEGGKRGCEERGGRVLRTSHEHRKIEIMHITEKNGYTTVRFAYRERQIHSSRGVNLVFSLVRKIITQ